jgi:hypothetical protein
MKHHKVGDRNSPSNARLFLRVVAKEAQVTNKVQFLIDLMRATAKVTHPVTVDQVVDFSFLDKARSELD